MRLVLSLMSAKACFRGKLYCFRSGTHPVPQGGPPLSRGDEERRRARSPDYRSSTALGVTGGSGNDKVHPSTPLRVRLCSRRAGSHNGTEEDEIAAARRASLAMTRIGFADVRTSPSTPLRVRLETHEALNI